MRLGALGAAMGMFGVTVTGGVAWSAPASPSPAQPAAQPPQTAIMVGVQARLMEFAREKLGELEPWQKTLFEQEVLSQPQRFVRDYKQTPDGKVLADIEADAVKQFLAYYGPKSSGRDPAVVLAYLRVEPGCPRCAGQAAAAKKLIESRLQNRGLQITWLTHEDFGGMEPDEKVLEERIAQLAQTRLAAATLVAELRTASVDNIDTAHADEKHYWVRVAWVGRGQGGSEDKSAGRLELLENDPMDVAVGRLLTDSFTLTGAKVLARAAAGGNQGEQREIALTLNGVKDFHHYSRIKQQLGLGLKDVGPMEERRFTRGAVTFALKTSKSTEDLKQVLAGMPVGEPKLGEPGRLAILDAQEQSIQVELR